MRSDLALAALASAAVPGMKPVTVAGVRLPDDGREADLQTAVVEDATGRRWVVRAPLTPVAGARLQRNDELVRLLARHVPFKVPAAVGYASVGKDGGAAVYPYVEGSPLDLHRLPGGPGLASAVGRALAAVHNIARGVFEEQDVPVYDAGGARQRIIAEVDRAAETGRVPTGLLARWEEAFDAAPMWQFATTPVHGSFTGDSVLVAFTDAEDAASGRVVAVTGWDEAMVGDPAVDLAELRAQASPEAWEAVLESYTLARAHRPDPYLHARALLVAELRNLRGLARGVAEGDEDAVRRSVEALRRADRLTEADDSLVPLTARPSGAAARRPVGAVVAPADPEERADDPVDAAEANDPETVDPETVDPETVDPDATMEVPRPEETGLSTRGGSTDEPGPDRRTTIDGVEPQAGARDGHQEQDDETAQGDDVPQQDETVPHDERHESRDLDPRSQPPGEVARARPYTPDDQEGQVDDPAEDPPADDAGLGPRADEPAGDGTEVPTAGGTGTTDDPDSTSLEDAERLHELYGMPDPTRDGDAR